MTSLINADAALAYPADTFAPAGPVPDRPRPTVVPGSGAWPRADLTRAASPALTALSRVRGGMYSSTVDLVRFTDGSTAHTDLIRLNPNIDAYSVDFDGVSPRRLAHYREVPWQEAPAPTAWWRPEIARVLANSYPAVSTSELTRRLQEAGYPVGTAEIRRHEAIAATQAVLWRLTNGLELDTQPLDLPVAVHARIGDHPSARRVQREAGRLDWHTTLPAGEPVQLELTLAEALQLRSFSFTVGNRTGHHDVELQLEQSVDGVRWTRVSRSRVEIGDRRTSGRRWQRRLGTAATLASADPVAGHVGHRHYRLTATGPWDRDGLLDLRDIRLEVGSGRRFRNNERVVYLYEVLLAQATSIEPVLPLDHAHARLLIGSSTPGGPAEFTPLVALVAPQQSTPDHPIAPVQPGLAIRQPRPSHDSRPNQEPRHVR